MNRYAPHVYVIPEDDRDRQLADGFVLHDQVNTARIQVMPPAGGWLEVLATFKSEYIPRLREDQQGHVIMLIDFDGHFVARRTKFEQAIPDEVGDRVFVVGSKLTPEALKKEIGKSFEDIGMALADDCYGETNQFWGHDHLKHNESDLRRLVAVVKPIIFGS